MAQNDIFDLCRSAPQLLEPIGDQLFRAVIVSRIDQDDSFRGHHARWNRDASDVVQVVEHFRRLRIRLERGGTLRCARDAPSGLVPSVGV